jgi:DNA-binding IclR family transcriptional regulator
MSEKKTRVLDFLAKKRMRTAEWFSPSEIGDEVIPHSKNTTGSSVASPVCKALVEDGLVERDHRGRYRIKR